MAASNSSVRHEGDSSEVLSVGAMWKEADGLHLVSGGFAVVQPGSQLSINAVEGFPVEEFSADVSVEMPQGRRNPH